MTILYLVLGLLVLSLVPMVWIAARTYRRHRAARVVTCPKSGTLAVVQVDAGRAARTSAFGDNELGLESCSRWPEHQACGQACLTDIEAAPAGCAMKETLDAWYRGSDCGLCGRRIGEVRWTEGMPALLSPEGKTVEWDAVTAEALPRVLATHRRLCWSCRLESKFGRRPGTGQTAGASRTS
jgi:hypothetical protein